MKQPSNSPTFEEALQNPAYEHLWETLKYLQTAKFADLFPEKHLLAHKSLIAQKLKALHGHSPLLPLKDVVAHTLESLPDDTSAAVVMELTRFAIDKWEAMAEKEVAEA